MPETHSIVQQSTAQRSTEYRRQRCIACSRLGPCLVYQLLRQSRRPGHRISELLISRRLCPPTSILGQYWVNTKSILGQYWVNTGSVLGQCWVNSGHGHRNSINVGNLNQQYNPLNRNMPSISPARCACSGAGWRCSCAPILPTDPASKSARSELLIMIHCFSCRPVTAPLLDCFSPLKQFQSHSLSRCIAVILTIFVSLSHKPCQQICTIQTARFPSHTPSKPLSLRSVIVGCCLTLALCL